MSKKASYVTHGLIRDPRINYPQTLFNYPAELSKIIEKYRPSVVGIEGAKDIRGYISTRNQSELIGCYKKLFIQFGIPYIEIPPTFLKKIIVGNGAATKEEVARTLSNIFNIDYEYLVQPTYYKFGPKKGKVKKYVLDGSDALGVALSVPQYILKVGKLDYKGRGVVQ